MLSSCASSALNHVALNGFAQDEIVIQGLELMARVGVHRRGTGPARNALPFRSFCSREILSTG